MRYKLTKQYAKEDENPLAEFDKLNDAILFVQSKLQLDEKETIKLVYRIFDDNILLKEINKEKIQIPISSAKYAEGILSLPVSFAMPCIVKQHEVPHQQIIAKFNNVADARIFVAAKIGSELNQSEIYFIFNLNRFVEKLDKTCFESQNTRAEGDQGKEKKLAFRPTPFAKTLRLGPQSWLVDEDDDDNKK